MQTSLIRQHHGIFTPATKLGAIRLEGLSLKRRKPEFLQTIMPQYKLNKTITKPTLTVIKDHRASQPRARFRTLPTCQ